MAKFRAVLMVPSVIEFENGGTMQKATEQAKRIADGMGKAKPMHPRQHDVPYTPKLVELICTEGEPKPDPQLDLDFEPKPA